MMYFGLYIGASFSVIYKYRIFSVIKPVSFSRRYFDFFRRYRYLALLCSSYFLSYIILSSIKSIADTAPKIDPPYKFFFLKFFYPPIRIPSIGIPFLKIFSVKNRIISAFHIPDLLARLSSYSCIYQIVSYSRYLCGSFTIILPLPFDPLNTYL